jgi:protein ImuB
MLWIALYFPQLALDSLTRGAGESLLKNLPLVIHHGEARRPIIYALNTAAREAGLRVGMPLAAARAACGDLTALARLPDKESQVLLRAAHWCAQYTPSVALDADCVLLEVSTTLKLFGGIGQLVGAIRHGLHKQGLHVLVGVAPTPLAAQLLAKATQYQPRTRMCRDTTQLAERLHDLPLILFGWPGDVINTLATLGLTRIHDLQQLPRRDLQSRFGDTVVVALDQALGIKADPRQYISLPTSFAGEHEFLFELTDSAQLLPSAESLLFEMEGFMRARAAATEQLVVTLKHGRNALTKITLGTREPQRHANHWLRLLREKFARAELAAPVMAISIHAEQLQPYLAQTQNLLHTRGEAVAGQMSQLVDRLAARLGDRAVYQLQVRDDHRPEFAGQQMAQADAGPMPQVVRKRAPQRSNALPSRRAIQPKQPNRPSWLLREPRALTVMQDVPQYHGALTLLAGPERIETGWWDGKPVARDYFVARNRLHEVCWIFRDYRQARQWFLHGLFA